MYMKLNPKCMNNGIQLAITNRGELIPCCRLDDPKTLQNPKVKKLTNVSNISDYETIDEILFQNEWLEFFENLQNDIAVEECFKTCGTNKEENKKQITIDFDSDGNQFKIYKR